LAWTIEYTDAARRQLRKLDRQSARRILDYMDRRIAPLEDVRSVGKALRVLSENSGATALESTASSAKCKISSCVSWWFVWEIEKKSTGRVLAPIFALLKSQPAAAEGEFSVSR